MKTVLISNKIKSFKKNKKAEICLNNEDLERTSRDVNNHGESILHQQVRGLATSTRKKSNQESEKGSSIAATNNEANYIGDNFQKITSDKALDIKAKKSKKKKRNHYGEHNIHCKLKANGTESRFESTADVNLDGVDSRCVSEVPDVKPPVDIGKNLITEYGFVKQLTQHAPEFIDHALLEDGGKDVKESNENKNSYPGQCRSSASLVTDVSKPAVSGSNFFASDSLKENRAKLEGMLRACKAGKVTSIPPNRIKSTINKLRKKLQLLNKEERKRVMKSELTEESICCGSTSRRVYNQSGNLVFNKFDFIGGKDIWADRKHNDLKKIMSKVISEKEKIKEMSQKHAKDAALRLESNAWEHAMQKVEGNKVKDDPMLLAKSIKRKENKKLKSKKKWAKHQQVTEKLIQQKIDKRRANILKRRQQKLERKKNRGKKVKPGKNSKKQKEKLPGF